METSGTGKAEVKILAGVGTRVDWAWEEVMAVIASE
jgi:hypothetical protein